MAQAFGMHGEGLKTGVYLGWSQATRRFGLGDEKGIPIYKAMKFAPIFFDNLRKGFNVAIAIERAIHNVKHLQDGDITTFGNKLIYVEPVK
jgi:hypothetical protein